MTNREQPADPVPRFVDKDKPAHIKPELRPAYREGWNDCRELIAHRVAQGAPKAEAPTGWKLVPLESTREMQKAAAEACGSDYIYAKCYRTMVAAAPSAPKAEAPTDLTETLREALQDVLDAHHQGRLVVDEPGSEGYVGAIIEAGESALAHAQRPAPDLAQAARSLVDALTPSFDIVGAFLRVGPDDLAPIQRGMEAVRVALAPADWNTPAGIWKRLPDDEAAQRPAGPATPLV